MNTVSSETKKFFLWFVLLVSLTSSGGAGEFLVLSDIHLNVFDNLRRDQFQHLSDSSAEDWPSVLKTIKSPISRSGSDSNYGLLISALDAAKAKTPAPSFILYPGDLLAHDWQKKYDQFAARPSHENPAAYRDFTRKTLTLIANELHDRYPDTPIYLTLGNDDSFCQDYWIQPRGEFLATLFDIWKPLFCNTKQVPEIKGSFTSLGCYALDLPHSSIDKLLVVNSVFWSASYCCSYFAPGAKNCCDCVNQGRQPGQEQFAWLKQELSRAKEEGRRVWLLMHVPPGLDSYAEEKASGRSRTATLWTDEFAAQYQQLMNDYADTTFVSFAGHTHMDDFRIDRSKGKPILLHKIVPGISPIFGNNPAFQTFQFDDTTGLLKNWKTFFLNPTDSTNAGSVKQWTLEYEARTAYQIDRVDENTMTRVFLDMIDDPDGSQADHYRRYYAASAEPIDRKDFLIYSCAVLNLTFEAYHDSLTKHGLAAPRKEPDAAQHREAAGSGK